MLKKALVRFKTRLQNGEYDNFEQLAPLLAPNEIDYIEKQIRMEKTEQEQHQKKERMKRLGNRFDEVNCMALYCLPVSDIELNVDNLPVELRVKGYDGSTESIIKITEVSYIFEKEYTPQLKITLIGQKTYGSNSAYDVIAYKLYDSEEYLIDTGMVYLISLDNGDKFKDDSIVLYDVIPGETYFLQLTEYSR